MAARKLHTIEKRMIPSSDRDIRVLILRPTESARSQENTLASCGSTEEAIFTACTRKYSYPMPAF